MREAPQLDFPLAQQFRPRARAMGAPPRSSAPRELPALTVPCKGEEGRVGVGGGQNPPRGRQMGVIHAAQFSRDCPRGHPGKLAVSERWPTARSCAVVAHTTVTVISVVSACV